MKLHISEGEKCARALALLRLLASTSQGGSGRAAETDWAPAALFDQVFIWQDVDPTDEKGVNAGAKYAEAVAGLILQGSGAGVQGSGEQQSAPEIFIVDLRAYWMALKGRELDGPEPRPTDGGGAEFNGLDVFDLILQLCELPAGTTLERLEKELADEELAASMRASLGAIAEQYSRYVGLTVKVHYPNQPEPLGAAPAGNDARAEILNWEWIKIGDKAMPGAVSIDAVRQSVKAATGEWPCRMAGPGGSDPLLFVDCGFGRVRWLGKSAGFEAFLHERGRLSFCEGQDKHFKNFVSNSSLYHSFGGSELVREYKGIEYYPHEPLMPGHYYAHQPPANYKADGRRLAQLLGFFKNFENPEMRLLFAAALCTPFWGGPYKERPCFIFTAPDKNCGKTTAATIIGKLCGGHIAISLDAKQEAQIKERLLTPSALPKRVVLADNIKRAMDSAVLEELITTEEISGKRLYYGEATRPNNITYLATANMPTVSRDLVLRSFFICMTKPVKDSDWARGLNTFMARHAEEVVCDILRLLRGPRKYKKLKPPGDERYPLWIDDVLNRVMADEAVAGVVGAVDDARVLTLNEEKRILHDDDRKQATKLWNELLPLLADEREWVKDSGTTHCSVWYPQGRVVIMAGELKTFWGKIFGREVNNTWLAGKMLEHMEAGRLPNIEHQTTRRGSEYSIAQEVVHEYLDSFEKERDELIAASGSQAAAGVVGEPARECDGLIGAQ